MRNPRISVCLLAWHHDTYLRKAMESVLEQRGPALELIVVDDGAASKWQALQDLLEDPRVKLHFTTPRRFSLGRLRREALLLARGRYYMSMDADDVLLPGALAYLSQVLDGKPRLSLVAAAVHSIDARGEPVGAEAPRFSRRPEDSIEKFQNVIYTCATLMRRRVVEELGGYSAAIATYADDDLFQRFPPQAIGVRSKAVALRRVTAESLTHRRNFRKTRERDALKIRAATLSRYFGCPIEGITPLLKRAPRRS